MKKLTIILYLIVFVFSEPAFYKYEKDNFHTKISIRIVNESKFKLTKISLFSIKFTDLNVHDTSIYKNLNFDDNRDDAMLYLTVNKKHFVLFVSPIDVKGKYSFIIDSVNVERRYIYMRRTMN